MISVLGPVLFTAQRIANEKERERAALERLEHDYFVRSNSALEELTGIDFARYGYRTSVRRRPPHPPRRSTRRALRIIRARARRLIARKGAKEKAAELGEPLV